MSDTVSLGGGIGLTARTATIETIFDHMRRHAPENPEFKALVAREKNFDAIGGWFFDDLSLDALLTLQGIIDHMAADLPAAAAHWKEEWRPRFYEDFERFRNKLAERINQLAAETGTGAEC